MDEPDRVALLMAKIEQSREKPEAIHFMQEISEFTEAELKELAAGLRQLLAAPRSR